VYNSETEKVRRVHVKPKQGWGGPGLLGADVSFGLAHHLPLRAAGKSALKGILGKLTNENKEDKKEEDSIKKEHL
jgi:hypothetical protein